MEKHLKSSDFIKDVVIGMSDGLTVPFALAAGLSGAVSNTSIITTAGIAKIVAGSIAMGLGGFLAGQTEVEHYDAELRREFEEVELYPEQEKKEVKQVFADYGLDESTQNIINPTLSQPAHQAEKPSTTSLFQPFKPPLRERSLVQLTVKVTEIGRASCRERV